eukprot:12330821-Ditylum_brightwellii.AAC.1
MVKTESLKQLKEIFNDKQIEELHAALLKCNNNIEMAVRLLLESDGLISTTTKPTMAFIDKKRPTTAASFCNKCHEEQRQGRPSRQRPYPGVFSYPAAGARSSPLHE